MELLDMYVEYSRKGSMDQEIVETEVEKKGVESDDELQIRPKNTINSSPGKLELRSQSGKKLEANKDLYIRRSTRDPAASYLERRDVKEMLQNITRSQKNTVVLKIKDHVMADINTSVMDAIIDALGRNKVCQALYVQNLSKSMHDTQVRNLVAVLKRKKIWCLNIGENYEVSTRMWEEFCRSLPETNVTHLYVSEHVIPLSLKNTMREHIRANRKKHDLHCSIKNLDVIERCTNMWWNPINGVKELKPYTLPPTAASQPVATKHTLADRAQDPKDVAYWQRGLGEGGQKPWKFKCVCGEECSWYENCRYHPTGSMFECTVCHLWSHTLCVLGPQVTDEDLEEMDDVLCRPCQTRYRRNSSSFKRRFRDETDENTDGISTGGLDILRDPSSSSSTTSFASLPTSSYSVLAGMRLKKAATPTTSAKKKGKKTRGAKAPPIVVSWRFKCICGETCSSYENVRYQPKGAIYSCSQCAIRSHVVCMLGEGVTQEEADKMSDLLCSGCKTKSRRNRTRGSEAVEDISTLSLQQRRSRSRTSSQEVEEATADFVEETSGVIVVPSDVTCYPAVDSNDLSHLNAVVAVEVSDKDVDASDINVSVAAAIVLPGSLCSEKEQPIEVNESPRKRLRGDSLEPQPDVVEEPVRFSSTLLRR